MLEFEYQITAKDYVACMRLYYKLSRYSLLKRGILWLMLGGLCVLSALGADAGWAPALLWIIGAWWIYCGLANLFPSMHFRRAYSQTDFAGRVFCAQLDGEGFEVTSDTATWKMKWAAVRLRGESEDAFVIFAEGIIFMFSKKYLSEPQQYDLRMIARLSNQ